MKFDAKYFNPSSKKAGTKIDKAGNVAYRAGDKPEDTYIYSPKTILAINLALATRRPLLVSGEPGSGKSTLAENAAAVLGWWYYKQMVSSRSQASDLLWTFDALRRLSDANTPGQDLLSKQHYIEPGTLWWAYSPETAVHRGESDLDADHHAADPGARPARLAAEKAVVLLDEIDKADPDVPNDLLEPFDLQTFTIRETNDRIKAKREALLIVTTNGERELSPAFMRRCVTLTLDPPEADWFVSIANQKYGAENKDLHTKVADSVMVLRKAAQKAGLREPSTGEYLDALDVCNDLGIDTSSDAWAQVTQSILWKHERKPEVDKSPA